ncbi:MAG: hypothetical protein Q9160_001141 [Pyrenula sp. 1 TL-2023]
MAVRTRSSNQHISRLPTELLQTILEELQYPDWKNLRTVNRLFKILLPTSILVKRKEDRLEQFALVEAAYYSQQRLGKPLAEECPHVAMGIGDAGLPCYGCFEILPLRMFHLRMHTFENVPYHSNKGTDWRDKFRQVEGRRREEVDKSMFKTFGKQTPRYCVRCAPKFIPASIVESLQRPCRNTATEFWGFCQTHGKNTKWHLLSSYIETDPFEAQDRKLWKGGCLCMLRRAIPPLKQEIRRLAVALRVAQDRPSSSREIKKIRRERREKFEQYYYLKLTESFMIRNISGVSID